MVFVVIILPLVGAFIGWMTNKIAIKLLFRPHNPIKIPILNYSLQGLLPKRRSLLANDVGKLVERDLLPIDEMLKKFKEPSFQKKLFDSLSISLYKRIIHRVPLQLPQYMKNALFVQVREVVVKEGPSIFDSIIANSREDLLSELSISKIVRERVEKFDMEKLEQVVVRIVNKELKHIEFLGAIIGFFIGVIQWIIVAFLLI